jgi:hypothetical protein
VRAAGTSAALSKARDLTAATPTDADTVVSADPAVTLGVTPVVTDAD